MSVTIITDSTSDLSPEEALSLGVRVVPLKVIFGEESFREGEELSTDEFYRRLSSEKTLPTTSQPSPDEFRIPFEQAVNAGDSVVAILISSKLSGTVQSACIARDMLEGDIHVIDSMQATASLRLMVEYAVRLRDAGKDAAAIEEALCAVRPRVRLRGVVDTLEYLYKGGRLSRTASVVGGLLRMKPVLKLEDGVVGMLSKARGTNSAITVMLDSITQGKGIDPDFPLILGYTATDEKCRVLNERMQASLSVPAAEHFCSVGCVIGTHAGPGACLIAYVEKA